MKNRKENRFQALLVKGARQIGETYSIQHFIDAEFSAHKTINFATNPAALDAFSIFGGVSDFELKLSLLVGDLPDTSDSVLVIGEIQLVYLRRDKLKANNPGSIDKTVDPITLI